MRGGGGGGGGVGVQNKFAVGYGGSEDRYYSLPHTYSDESYAGDYSTLVGGKFDSLTLSQKNRNRAPQTYSGKFVPIPRSYSSFLFLVLIPSSYSSFL